MVTITISKDLMKNNDFVVLPRKEYEEFSQWREVAKLFKTFTPTALEKKDVARARKNRAKGNFLTSNELKNKLGFTN